MQALFDLSENPGALSSAGGIRAGRRKDGLIGGIARIDAFRQEHQPDIGHDAATFAGAQADCTAHGRARQHEHQALLNPQRHREFLDEFGDAAHAALRERVADAYAALRDARTLLAQTELDASNAPAGWIPWPTKLRKSRQQSPSRVKKKLVAQVPPDAARGKNC